MSMSNDQKEAKLKASIQDFVGPFLKRLILAKELVPEKSDMENIIQDVEKVKYILDSIKNWDRELVGCFGKIEREIDYWTDQKVQLSIDQTNILDHLRSKLNTVLKDFLNQKDEKWSKKSPIVKTVSDSSPESKRSENEESSSSSNQTTEGFMEFLECMKSLNPQLRNCLYSLGVFPERTELKMRLVVSWWIGLGLVPFGENRSRTADQLGEIFFSDLVDKGVLIPVYIREHNQVVDRCIIKPTIHRQLISACKKKSLIKEESSEDGTWHIFGDDSSSTKALLNLDQRYLNSMEISNKNDMQVVQLGRWHYTEPKANCSFEGSEKIKEMDHIEVDEIDFLGKMGENVRYLSLRGISRIEELHESIGKLQKNLMILNLRACHNLEKLPQKPSHNRFRRESWFKTLRHLDISECYLLDHMPKWLSEVSNLEVLKGFVVGTGGSKSQSCQIKDLKKLKKIRKLSMRIATGSSIGEDLNGLVNLENLLVLTIIWRDSGDDEASEGNQDSGKAEGSGGSKDSGIREVSEGNEKLGKVEGIISNKDSEIKEVNGGNGKSEKQEGIVVYKDSEITEVSGGSEKSDKGEAIVGVANKDSENMEASGGSKESEKLEANRGGKESEKIGATKKDEKNVTFPKNLEKLDIRCFPNDKAQDLLNPAHLRNLKRLYIRGGKLAEITTDADWQVETLRLRFLKHLKVEWNDLRVSFKNLKCVEYVKCPKLEKFPNGSIWRLEENNEPSPNSEANGTSSQS